MSSTTFQEVLKEQINTISDYQVDKIPNLELVTIASDSASNFLGLRCRHELIERGKDNIPTRIEIKKFCRETIHDLESAISDVEAENIYNKDAIKSFKTRFLNLLSVLDKLQLEWQKHDIGLNLKLKTSQ